MTRFYAVLDTETTGFKPTGDDRILELAIVKLDQDGTEVSRWCTLLDPQTEKIGATHIHGITPEMLVGAPTFKDVAGDIIAQLSGAVLVAHNAPFDVGFLKAEFARADIPWGEPFVADTLGAARFLMPGLPAYKLGFLAEHLGLTFDGDAHSALADAVVTASLFRHLTSLTSDVTWPATVDVTWADIPVSGRAVQRTS